MTNRRTFLQTLLVGLGILGIPSLAARAGTISRRPSPGVAEILVVSFPAVKANLCGGRPFSSPDLNQAVKDGTIRIRPLAATVAEYYGGLSYPVEELVVPIVWSAADEIQPSENARISLVSSLLRNAFSCHDELIREALTTRSLVVSREYRCALGEVQILSNGDHLVKLYTALARLPKR